VVFQGEPVSDLLVTVKSREMQRGMSAEMRGDPLTASRHFLAAAHLELVGGPVWIDGWSGIWSGGGPRRAVMERKAKYVVRLDELERGRLQEMVDRGKGSKTIRNRALILLKADAGEHGPGWPDAKIAEAFDVGVRTVERTRRLLVTEGFEAVLARKPSPNRQYRKLDGAQEAALVKVACSRPPAGRARWTLQLLADRLVELKVVTSVGREAVRTTLQKTLSSRGSGSSGFCPRRPTPSSSARWRASSRSTNGPTTPSARSSASTSSPSN